MINEASCKPTLFKYHSKMSYNDTFECRQQQKNVTLIAINTTQRIICLAYL